MVSVLVIGAGTMGATHIDAYKEMDDVRIVGIVDQALERAQNLAKGICPVFQSLDEAVNLLESIDVIDVSVPTPLHKEYVMKAAELGTDVICEKPLAKNLEDAKEMIDVCNKKGVRLFVGHVVRFFPEYREAKRLIDEGEIGMVGIARTFRGGVFPRGYNNWYQDVEKSGGVSLDLIIHDFDYLRWVLGDVERVYAKGLRTLPTVQKDYNLVTLRFKNGAIAHVEGSWAHQGFRTAFEFSGTEGIIDFDSSKATPVTLVADKQDETFSGVAVPKSPMRHNPYFLELRHFMDCLKSGETPIVTAEDAYKALEISLAAYESIKTGKAVTIQ